MRVVNRPYHRFHFMGSPSYGQFSIWVEKDERGCHVTMFVLWKTLVDADSCLAVIHQEFDVDYLFRCRKQLDQSYCNLLAGHSRVIGCSVDNLLNVVHVVDSHCVDPLVGSCRFLHFGEFVCQVIVFILEFDEIGYELFIGSIFG